MISQMNRSQEIIDHRRLFINFSPLEIRNQEMLAFSIRITLALFRLGKWDSHYPMTKEASLTEFRDTVRNDQAVQYDCGFTSPYVGEPCKDICSRVYD